MLKKSLAHHPWQVLAMPNSKGQGDISTTTAASDEIVSLNNFLE